MMTTEERRLVFLGFTGYGKSATINSVIGRRICKSEVSAKSVTKKCQLLQQTIDGKPTILVDTPGLSNTEMTEEEFDTELAKVVGITAPGAHCFILVIRIGRFTAQDISSYEHLAHFFGDEMYIRAIILFTGMDDLDNRMTFKAYINSYIPPKLQALIAKCNRPVEINNRADDPIKASQVRNLMQAIDEVVKKNSELCYKSGKYPKVEAVIADEEKRRKATGRGENERSLRETIRRDIEREDEIYRRVLAVLGIKQGVSEGKAVPTQEVKQAVQRDVTIQDSALTGNADIGRRLDQLEKHLLNIDAKVDNIDAKVDNIDAKVNKLLEQRKKRH